MMAVVMVTFTSCRNSDEMAASFIDGYWEGDLTTSFYSYFGNKYIYTQIEFVRENRYGGRGVERDYYNHYDYKDSYFRWTVENEYIIMRYEDGTQIYAYFNGPRHDIDGVSYWYGDWYSSPWWSKQHQMTDDKTTNNEKEEQ